MAKILDATITTPPGPLIKEKTFTPTTLWQRLALGSIIVISLFMNFFELGQNGFGNLFYAAGIRSMLDSWHNFFFVSYDPEYKHTPVTQFDYKTGSYYQKEGEEGPKN